MTLRTSQLRELENPNLSVDQRAELACELARQLEDRGEYEEAQNLLGAYWRGFGERPNLTGLEPGTAAEVLLRAGVLTGAIGSKNQIIAAQETAKNLISESLAIFQERHFRKRIAEAQGELALCYWRSGEVNEARDLLEDALSRLTVDSELKSRTVLRLAIVEIEASTCDKTLQLLTAYESLFERINNQTIRGSYYVTLGNVFEKLWEAEKRAGYLDRALVEYAAASFHFEQAEHKTYLANVENNLGLLYFTINRCDEALEHLNRARRILTSLKEISTVAQVDETRARLFLKQGRVTEAERAARSSVNALEKCGRQALLAEALITYGRALGRLGNFSASLSTFRQAIELAQHVGCLNRAGEAALAAFQELGDHLAAKEGQTFISGRGLIDEIRAFEHEAIKRALENYKGSVTLAARSLRLSYQALSYMLETRHKDLLPQRTPARRRPRKSRRRNQ
ncbi:MAG TPA: helix-turn-helix domain-containing protein [Pyrinomonadaceae bacterium]|nr:helix-turn-helix domain-containing protein [Pyrinomonadaceae bacterium]